MNDEIKWFKQLVHGSGIISILSAIGLILSFVFKLIAARYFGPEDFGQFSLIETIFSLVFIISSIGIVQGITRYLPIYKHEQSKDFKNDGPLKYYLNFVFTLPFLFSIIFSLIIFIFAEKITLFFNFPILFSTLLRIISFAFPFRTLNKTLSEVLLADKLVFPSKFSFAILEKVVLLFGIILIYFLKLSIMWLVIVFLISTILGTFYNLYIYFNKIKLPHLSLKLIPKKHYLQEWIKFSLPLFFTGFFTYFISWTDNLLIGKYLSPKLLGIYAIAYSFTNFLGFFQSSFGSMFMPLIAEHYATKRFEQITILFKQSAAWIFGLTFPLFLIMVIYSKQVLTIFYGINFSSGYIPLIIISFGLMVNVSTGLSANILMLYKKTRFIFYTNVIIASFNLVLNMVLIPFYGLIGAAISSAISIAFQNVIFLIKAKAYQKLNFNLKYNFKFIFAGVLAVLISSLFLKLDYNLLVILIISLFVYLFLYFLFLLILKTFTKEDLFLLLELERKIGLKLTFLKKIIRFFY